MVERQPWMVALITLQRDVVLLDLRGPGAMRAGSVAALAKVSERPASQEWSRYFYENPDVYGHIDGLLYFNAHNDEESIAMYERCQGTLACRPSDSISLADAMLDAYVHDTARRNNMIVLRPL